MYTPTVDEMNACLGIVFVGTRRPTLDDYKRTSFVVRRKYVLEALEWLVLNHKDYCDVTIDASRLNGYDESRPPGIIAFAPGPPTERGENISVFENVEEKGTTHGPCPLYIQGLSADMVGGASPKQRVAEYVQQHLNREFPVVALGHSNKPESLYENSALYPSMFPWLFPYGLGGFDCADYDKRIDRNPHIQRLLDYHDHRFETDYYFPFIVLNHNQLRASFWGGRLVTDPTKFRNVAEKVALIDSAALNDLIVRGRKTGHISAEQMQSESVLNL